MRLNRLRVAGFKSFVDPTDIAIADGLTGLVGPNGCGKSNLVEALRWAMGEGSARQLRGAEMDDVIFNGSDRRPPRAVAEVTLGVELAPGRAPAPFQDETALEVARRIDRGQGSTYRINGRDSRARDVQMLFADAGSGANSPSLVGQGKIARLIAAKPGERRAVLEDAAGVAGLQSRRAEAESRLRAAEQNLVRVEDLRQSLDRQRQGLARQARQAERYRELGAAIRRIETIAIAAAWTDAVDRRAIAAERLTAAETAAAAATSTAARAAIASATAAAAPHPLRAERERLIGEESRWAVRLAEIDAEARRVAEATAALARTLTQVDADLGLNARARADGMDARDRLEAEMRELGGGSTRGERDVAAADAAARAADVASQAAEASLGAIRQRRATATAERAQIDATRADLAGRRRRLEQEGAALAARRNALAAERVTLVDPAVASAALSVAEAARERAAAEVRGLRGRRGPLGALLDRTRADERARRLALDRLEGEASALDAALAADLPDDGVGRPAVAATRAEPGYEAALAGALADAGQAAEAPGAGAHWRVLPPLPVAFAAEAEPLLRHVEAPACLGRRLAAVGVVADAATAERLLPELALGAMLVSRDGASWNWDGLARPATAATATALRLRRLNRRRDLEPEMEAARAAAAAASADRAEAEAALVTLDAAIDEADRAARAADDAWAQATGAAQRALEATARLDARVAGLDETAAAHRRLGTEIEEAEAKLFRRSEALPADAPLADELSAAEAAARAARETAVATRAERDRLVRDLDQHRRRLRAVEAEAGRWHERLTDLASQADALVRRADEARSAQTDLADAPIRLERDREQALATRADVAAALRLTADRLVEAEAAAAAADRVRRQADQEATLAREAVLLAQGATEQAREAAVAVARRMAERLGCTPSELGRLLSACGEIDATEGADAPQRLDRLTAEREALGPVNLRAGEELTAIQEQLAELDGQCGDLRQAIARLRGVIGALNREGRERLRASFEAVDGHFRAIFTRLFGGGEARLELTDAEDPLESGLEIHACPPGKRLLTLSLMSGGEQALTAIALVVAVFLTNPSPICVLDEVDAPLDDANVDRFCDLLEDVAGRTGTRFLVVTHHRLTMARMDRLYGVTMSERGVSRVVSVDLGRAEELREAG
jgi:chromosome segregation protein